MHIGIFGGSFDPVHYGHLLLAEACRDQSKLDRIIFLPAGTPPHKQNAQQTPADHRLAMLKLAIGGNDSFEISTMEIDRGGISYTVDTLQQIHQTHPQDKLYFLMGADSLAEMGSWRSPKEICELACPIVVRRAGSPDPNIEVLSEIVDQQRLKTIQQCQVKMPVIELSSTGIRQAIANGQRIRYQTPRAVEVYIRENGLFQPEDA